MLSKKSQEKLYKDKDINVYTVKLLEKMQLLIKDISNQLQQYLINLKNYIDDSEKVSSHLNKKISRLINDIKDQNDPNYIDITENKKKIMEEIKDISKAYDRKIFIIYENNLLENIKKYNQDLNEIINDKMPEANFQPPNINSFSNEDSNVRFNYEIVSYKENNDSKSLIQDYNSFIDSKIPDDSLNAQVKKNNIKISCKCTICNENEIINFCEICNKLFCESCYNSIKEAHPHKSIFFITNLKSEIELKRNLFINSLRYMIKSLLLKGNELINSEYIKFGNSSNSSFENLFNNDINKSNSSPNINYIKRIIFNYPYLEKFNFESELKFLTNLNKIIINDLDKKIIKTESFHISEMNKYLIRSIAQIFVDDKINLLSDALEKIENNFLSDDDYNGVNNEVLNNEKIGFKIDENEFMEKKNLFYYVVYIMPQRKNIIYNNQNIKAVFTNLIKEYLNIEANNILISFNNKKSLINAYIKMEPFMTNKIKQIKYNYPDFEKLYEYKTIYDYILKILKDKNFFDISGNTICFNSNCNLIRGMEKYYPPYKWFGIGLNVIDKYDDNEWLDIDSKKWAIAYYSFSQTLSSNQILEELNKIIIKGELIEEKFTSSSKDKRNRGKKVGNGVYLYQDIEMAERFTGKILIKEKRYKIVLMAKVLTEKIREPEDINYWILDKKFIRFYRILIKEDD